MPTIDAYLRRFEASAANALATIPPRRVLASLVLLLLALVCYLPGAVNLPPVDRTEVVYAESSRALLERGDLIDPQFGGRRDRFRPIGTYWLQLAVAAVRSEPGRSDITTYRIPSLIGVILAALATFWLLAPLIGARGSFVAAALFAVTPIAALQSQLAVTEGAVLGAAVAAQLALLRIYCAGPEERTRALALLFWAAQGVSICLNALAVPILSLVTVIALAVFDRRLDWLKRLEPLIGAPIMLVLASPWLIARYLADGGLPFQGMAWGDFLELLGGSQSMKHRAMPGSFVLALVVGFLPGTILLVAALRGIWEKRAELLPRFLLAWLIGYLVYLEAVSSKPALYTVQVMFPAAAAAVALAMSGRAGARRGLTFPRGPLLAVSVLGAVLVLALYAGVLWAAGQPPTPGIVVGALTIAVLFALAARARELRLASAWVTLTVAGMAVFLGFTFGGLLPRLQKPWPAIRIAEAAGPLKACVSGPIALLGFREPSATFVLRDGAARATPEEIAGWQAAGERRVALVEERWHGDLLVELAKRNAELPQRFGCIEAYNVMRGCSLAFAIYVTGPADTAIGCAPGPEFACKTPIRTVASDESRAGRCR